MGTPDGQSASDGVSATEYRGGEPFGCNGESDRGDADFGLRTDRRPLCVPLHGGRRTDTGRWKHDPVQGPASQYPKSCETHAGRELRGRLCGLCAFPGCRRGGGPDGCGLFVSRYRGGAADVRRGRDTGGIAGRTGKQFRSQDAAGRGPGGCGAESRCGFAAFPDRERPSLPSERQGTDRSRRGCVRGCAEGDETLGIPECGEGVRSVESYGYGSGPGFGDGYLRTGSRR